MPKSSMQTWKLSESILVIPDLHYIEKSKSPKGANYLWDVASTCEYLSMGHLEIPMQMMDNFSQVTLTL